MYPTKQCISEARTDLFLASAGDIGGCFPHEPSSCIKTLNHLYLSQLDGIVPPWLRKELAILRRECGQELYLSGGSLRDLLLGRIPHDIDLTIAQGAQHFAQTLAECTNGAFVPLDAGEDVARVVSGGLVIDVAAFREGTNTIEEDLQLRDFTINALAVSLDNLLDGQAGDTGLALPLLDPCGGYADIKERLIRLTHAEAFSSDPLRMLRAFRLAATLDCRVDTATAAAIQRDHALIRRSAAERVAAELNALMLSPRSHGAVLAMQANGLLFEVLPELAAGAGVQQPASHHLDVLGHSLEALHQVELLIAEPEQGFPDCSPVMRAWLSDEHNILILKWAALLHDLGKPATWAQNSGPDGRITFYQHEQAGVKQVQALARRLRWSTRQTERISLLISQHMRPFHLLNVARQGELSLKACIRLVRAVGEELPGLLLLAQADAQAGKGESRPENMEYEVAGLAARLHKVRDERVLPVQSSPPLLGGRDLIKELGLIPGPLFKIILEAVDLARMEGTISARAEALGLAQSMAAAIVQEEKVGK